MFMEAVTLSLCSLAHDAVVVKNGDNNSFTLKAIYNCSDPQVVAKQKSGRDHISIALAFSGM